MPPTYECHRGSAALPKPAEGLASSSRPGHCPHMAVLVTPGRGRTINAKIGPSAGKTRHRPCCFQKASSLKAAHLSLLPLAGVVSAQPIPAHGPHLLPLHFGFLPLEISPLFQHHLPHCSELPCRFCPALPGKPSSGPGLGDLTCSAEMCFVPPSPSAASGMLLSLASCACSSFLASRKAISA